MGVEIDDASDDKQEEEGVEEDVAANSPDERRIADLLIIAVAGACWARQAAMAHRSFLQREKEVIGRKKKKMKNEC